jgi:DNA-binding Lrp family transcriptional regulator
MKREILEILQENDRVTSAEIAVMLGLPEEEVRAEIAALERNNTIVKYHAMINWEKTEIDRITAMIDVRVTPQREVGFDEIARRIYRFPEVRSVYLMSGAYDLSVLVEARNIKELALFVAEKLAAMDHITGTVTHFVLKRYKQEGVILDEQNDAERLVVSP